MSRSRTSQAVTMKRTLHLLLALAGLSGFALAAPSLPADARFDAPVRVEMVPGGVPLESLLRALASSVGLNLVAEGVPNKTVAQEFAGKPFRQVFELLIALNGLDFEMKPNDVVVVGPPAVVNLVRAPVPAPVAAAPAPLVRESYVVRSDPAAVQAFLAKEFSGVGVNALAGSRVLSITATAAQQAEIRTLLAQVDLAPQAAPAGPVIVRRTFRLSNSSATRLAEVLTRVVQGPTPTAPVQNTALPNSASTTIVLPSTGTGASAEATPGPQVTVTADETSNTLIVSGPQAQVESIAGLIPQLDQRQSLVNVNVRIQQVDDSAGRTLGIDWKAGLGNFALSIVSGGLNFLADATRSVAGLNIGATLNALENQGLSKRVDDQTITVLNNGVGKLASGGKIELNLPGSGGSANISKSIEFGVLTSVRPQVAADGTITLGINAEVSDVLNAGNLDPNRIDFTKRSSDTVVRLQSGQTVLLGSLLTTTSATTTDGVPILSAIPLIGELFKTRKTSDRQVQLLIVITANTIE